METTNNPINRVKCEVNTCRFHSKENRCLAEAIEVAPRNANNSNETDCATFIPGSNGR